MMTFVFLVFLKTSFNIRHWNEIVLRLPKEPTKNRRHTRRTESKVVMSFFETDIELVK